MRKRKGEKEKENNPGRWFLNYTYYSSVESNNENPKQKLNIICNRHKWILIKSEPKLQAYCEGSEHKIAHTDFIKYSF